ncbi:hypothetical protein BKA70DRAFT_1554222 [Coprinopsis sp. MPI-PUGE-AT-0042]|nr:hypothetical protein BKA70DRAFT_1554222 [Coprinopsis sp. MPI-PUGE-AT-0042]
MSVHETSNSSAYLRSMDIWYHIATFLDPPNLLVLRASCSMLLALCRQRSIWLQAARTMCRSHGLFLPSFSFETMSVEELTRLALSPFAFSRLFSMESKERLLALQTRSFNPRLHGSQDILKLRSLHLLPGGRYLLTYHEQHVCMWDLGYGGVAPRPFPIAALHTKTIFRSYGEKPPCPTVDEMGVRFVVLSGDSPAAAWALEIYEIYPGSKDPVFQCITSWQVPVYSDILGYTSRYVILDSDNMVQIYAIGDVNADGPRCSLRDLWIDGDYPTRVAILGDVFVMWCEDIHASMKVLSIPPISTSVTTPCLPNLIIPTSIPGELMGMLYTSEWAGASTNNSFFALGTDVFSPTTELHLYQMVDLGPLANPRLPLALPTKLGKVPIANWSNFIGGPNLQPLASDFAVIGISGGQLTVAKISMSCPLQEDSKELPAPSIKTLTDSNLYKDNDILEEVSACLATGRLVTSNAGDGGTDWIIRVIDYLSLA